MIEAVIFDLDDTLYNEMDFVLSGFAEVCNYLSLKHKIDFYVLFNETISILNKQGRGKIFDTLCKIHEIKEDIPILIKIYRNCEPNIKLYDDALDILEKLKGKYKLGLITDGKSNVQRNKIKALDIEKYFHKIIVTDDYGQDYWKPSTKAFELVLSNFGVKSEESVYVADNPNKDFIPCKRLGIHSIRIIREQGEHINTILEKEYEADFKISSLNELETLHIFTGKKGNA